MLFSSSEPSACKHKTIKCVIVSSGKRCRLPRTLIIATLTAQEIIVQHVRDDEECEEMCQKRRRVEGFTLAEVNLKSVSSIAVPKPQRGRGKRQTRSVFVAPVFLAPV